MKSFDLLHCPLLAGGVINDKRSPFALFFQWHLRINPFLCIMFINVIPFHQACQLSGWVTEKIDRRFDWRTWELKINGFGIDYPINVAIYPLYSTVQPFSTWSLILLYQKKTFCALTCTQQWHILPRTVLPSLTHTAREDQGSQTFHLQKWKQPFMIW